MATRRLPVIAAIAAAALGLGLGFCKPALIRTDENTRLAVFWRGQSGQVRFVNSVTGRPVTIRFRIGSRFQAFSFSTDEASELYYTGGLYDLNTTVATESTDRLRFCSVQGLSLTLGSQTIAVKDTCLEVALLWTI